MRRNVDRKTVVAEPCSFVPMCVVFFLALSTPARKAGATGNETTNVRLDVAIDDSGSMLRAERFRRGIQVVERWVEAIDLNDKPTIELLTASDHIVHQGTFWLRDEDGRGCLLDRLRELEPERFSKTVFRKIDEELATFIGKHTRPDERLGVVFVTDGRSDSPATDLRLQEMGDQVLPLGGGLYAAVSGPIPAQGVLAGVTRGRAPLSRWEPAPSQSKYRRLLAPSITLAAPLSLRAVLREQVLGGFKPVQVAIELENSIDIPRAVRLRVRAPDGVTGRFTPDMPVLAGKARTEVVLELAVTSPLSAGILVTAQGPDGSVAEATIKAEIATRSWLASNWRPMSGCGSVAALLLGALLVVGRRAWFLAPIGRPDRGFDIRPGEEVPLSTAEPGFPSGTWIRRRRGGLWLRTDGEPMRVGGIPVQPGREIRYRLRTPIDAGSASIVLDRRSRRQAATRPVVIAGTNERTTACDELL